MKRLLIAGFLITTTFAVVAQSTGRVWNNKKCAVVLTYDDASFEHLDNALPVLDSLQLKATFYLTANTAKYRINDWKKAAANMHELGNHTIFHPCVGAGRAWVKPEYDMDNYTVKRMVDEIKMANGFLEALDGKKERTFAFTCGDMKVKDTFFMDLLKDDFIAARAVRHEMHTIDKINVYNIDCYAVNGESAIQLEEWVKKAMGSNSLLVILFHGVGGGNALNISLSAHREFLIYLKQHENDIWIAPLIDVAKHIKVYQAKQL